MVELLGRGFSHISWSWLVGQIPGAEVGSLPGDGYGTAMARQRVRETGYRRETLCNNRRPCLIAGSTVCRRSTASSRAPEQSPNLECRGQRVTAYHINVFYSDDDGGYIADIPDLEACSAFAPTARQALTEVMKAREAWLVAARDAGKPIPEPRYRPAIYTR
jgi:predicted RNase H-like HicB family nuclease